MWYYSMVFFFYYLKMMMKLFVYYIDNEDECRAKTFLKDDPSFDLAVANTPRLLLLYYY